MAYNQTNAEKRFHALLLEAGIPPQEIITEHRFHKHYRYRLDFFFPRVNLAVEVDGGVFHRGRHVRPSGYMKDCDKYNLATAEGIRILRTSTNKQQMEEVAKLAAQLVREWSFMQTVVL